ncbi:MAG: LCP family protein [Acidimicrobiales bacterium]
MTVAVDGTRLRRTWPQRLLIGFNALLVLSCLAAAASLGYVDSRVSKLQRVSLGHVLSGGDDESSATGPENFLLVGVDSAEGLDPNDPVRYTRPAHGLLSDTIMVLRIHPQTTQAELLSFPRDLWVPIAGTGRSSKINSALSTGGPDRLIQTLLDDFGIEIHHYVQVDFAGFRDLVRAIDGVPVYFDTPARDEWTGLEILETGCVTLDGEQALAYARARHYQTFEGGRWRTDGTSDLGRISRQQDFIKRALRRAVAKGVRNPVTLNQLVGVGLRNVTVDQSLSAGDIGALARRFRNFDPASLASYSLPTVGFDASTGADALKLVERDAQPILDIFRGVDAPASPAAVQVRVLNGAGLAGEGRRISEGLRRVGFEVVAVADARRPAGAETRVRYPLRRLGSAQLVAAYLDGPVVLEPAAELSGSLEVVIGAALAGVREAPLEAGSAGTTAPSAPGAAPAAPGTGPAGETGPTTTVIGSVPTAPPGVQCG